MFVINQNTEKESKLIKGNLLAFNAEHVLGIEDSHKEVSLNVKNAEGEIVAGVLSEILWNWLEVSFLWVDEAYRKHGLGVKLLERIESIAKENNCVYIKLDTFHFQALDFYQKQGYKVFGTLENPDIRLTHYYLMKYL